MSAIKTWISHNQGMFFALAICTALLVWTYGCESTVTSLTKPALKVNAAELELEIQSETARLEAELDQLIKSAKLRKDSLTRQDAIKQKLYQFASITAQAGTVNPAGLITLAGTILGIGAVVDNRIKDKVIANRPLTTNNETATSS